MTLQQPTPNVLRKAASYWYQQRVWITVHGPRGCHALVRSASSDEIYDVMVTDTSADCTCPLGQINASRQRPQPCTHVTATLLCWRALYPRDEEAFDNEQPVPEAARRAEGH